MPSSRVIRSLLLVVLLLMAPSMAAAQVLVKSTQWGWDNKMRPYGFNLVTVIVTNSGNNLWRGSFRMINKSGALGVDVPLIEPDMVIEPGGDRQLQFLVYVESTNEFELSWGRRQGEQYLFNSVETGTNLSSTSDPAIIMLRGFRSRGSASVSSYPEEYFPNSAAGMFGLRAVLLDHAPDLTPAQQKALLDWIHGGGELHLFGSSASEPLEFNGVLTPLNQPFEQFAIGSGVVIRHAVPISKANRAYIDREIRGRATIQKDQSDDQNNYWYGNVPSAIYRALELITRPDHNWALIYLLAFAYLLLIFPGGWLVGRYLADYRLTYLGIIGLVVLFSLAFDQVGRRGYGEVTSVNSCAIARPAAEGRSSVLQYSNVFVTSGGQYEIEHPEAEDAAYSSGQTNELVRGAALNRPLGQMIAEIPAFSNRTMLHTAIVPYSISRLSIAQVQIDSDGDLQNLELRIDDEQAWPANVFEMRLIYGDRIWTLTRRDANVLVLGNAQHLPSLLQQHEWYRSPYATRNHESPDQLFAETFVPAIAIDLEIFSQDAIQSIQLPRDVVRIYVFAEAPDEFKAVGSLTEQQAGRVLFVQQVRLPEDAWQAGLNGNRVRKVSQPQEEQANTAPAVLVEE
ncbi:MAG: hypothetical protein KDA58_10490 [Planctomycetaceae bacterium]|nr:hypothetical protein [Planctomycetaceae bacterium]